jgi:hypothetical protein
MAKLKQASIFLILAALLIALILVIGSRRACGDVCVASELILSVRHIRKEIDNQLSKSTQINVSSINLPNNLQNYYLILPNGTLITNRNSVTLVLEPKLATGKVNWVCYGNPVTVHSILKNSDCAEIR